MIPKETISSGAALTRCEFCGEVPALGIYKSAGGYYIGYACCSPFSRESGYYRTHEKAQAALDAGEFGR